VRVRRAVDETERLNTGTGLVEFLRTVELIERSLPAPPSKIADIGGGPGRYADHLISRSYDVVL
jgi:ubiquinone/menaquinone biosynthesis C-methylase UbiE